MKRKGEIIIPAIALFLICLVSTLLLALTNHVTKDQIVKVQAQAADEARKMVCPEASDFALSDQSSEEAEIYTAKDGDGNEIGYAITTTGKSYGGDIKVMTGFDMDGTVLGVQILSIDDTPGLGMNAKKDSFRDQYIGKTGTLTVSKNATNDEIQAITGATITSTAVTDCVNQAYNKLFGEGGK